MEYLSNIRQTIVVRKDLNMRKGKIAAQVAHASNVPLVNLIKLTEKYFLMQKGRHPGDGRDKDFKNLAEKYTAEKTIIESWIYENKYTKIVLGCNSEEELLDLIKKSQELEIPCYPIYDMGLTEFHGKETLTCCSFGPFEKEKLDKLTGKLQLI